MSVGGTWKVGGGRSYELSMQGNYDDPMSGNYQALSHWNTSVEIKYLPYTYLGEGWAGSKAFESNVKRSATRATWQAWPQQMSCKFRGLPAEPHRPPRTDEGNGNCFEFDI